MKVGTLTFHGAHNYGSVLQAYALQKALDRIVGEDNHEIINYRKKEQKQYYSVYHKAKDLKTLLSNIYAFRYSKSLKKKNDKFEEFISEYLPLSEEIGEYNQVEEVALNYDAIICGSDQIWNVGSFDFDWAYMLPFNNYSNKKISYATSFGGSFAQIIDNKEKISELLSGFDHLSVREINSQLKLSKLLNRQVSRICDPTILLTPKEWLSMVNNKDRKHGDYILFYSLGPSKEDIKLIENISRKLGLKVIITNTANRNDKMLKAERIMDSGPIDFLYLVKNAKLVCTSSFHCTVFSILFKRPFFCINVQNEERLSSLLEITGLEERHINNNNIEQKVEGVFDKINFEYAHNKLEEERLAGISYLKKVLS